MTSQSDSDEKESSPKKNLKPHSRYSYCCYAEALKVFYDDLAKRFIKGEIRLAHVAGWDTVRIFTGRLLNILRPDEKHILDKARVFMNISAGAARSLLRVMLVTVNPEFYRVYLEYLRKINAYPKRYDFDHDFLLDRFEITWSREPFLSVVFKHNLDDFNEVMSRLDKVVSSLMKRLSEEVNAVSKKKEEVKKAEDVAAAKEKQEEVKAEKHDEKKPDVKHESKQLDTASEDFKEKPKTMINKLEEDVRQERERFEARQRVIRQKEVEQQEVKIEEPEKPKKFLGLNLSTWIIIGVGIAGAIVLMILLKKFFSKYDTANTVSEVSDYSPPVVNYTPSPEPVDMVRSEKEEILRKHWKNLR